jgi:hypothetical protein
MRPFPQIVQTPSDHPFISVRDIVIDNPAAGAEIAYVVPVGIQFKLNALFFQLVTDANVANRLVHLYAANSYGIVYHAANATGPAENMTSVYSVAPSNSYRQGGAAPFIVFHGWPDNLILEEGARIYTVTDLIQVGDQFGPITMQYQSIDIEDR